MTSQPDKFFRDKLENFQQPAPSGAWDRIESNLTRPSYKLVWVRIAAGIALLAVTALVWWPSETTKTEIAITKENVAVKKDTQQPDQAKAELTEEAVKQKTESIVAPKITSTITVAKIENEPAPKTISVDQDSISINPVPQTQELIAVATHPEKNEPTSKTIVYTAEEVNSKFLKKKLPPQATSENPEASGIQKLIGLAYAAKNSEAPLGNLRQKKDDILALNFGKKKGEN